MTYKHTWSYAGGIARCVGCRKYLQPDGRVTDTPTGRKGKARKE
jgi:hypothetical protein